MLFRSGVIVRTRADAVPQQSRAATGVRLQKLDAGDRLTEVVLVPPAAEDDGSDTPLDGDTVAGGDIVADGETVAAVDAPAAGEAEPAADD